MASSSSSFTAQLGPPVAEKLTRDNHLLWKAQFLPTVRGAQLMGILDGSTSAPAKTMEVEDAEKKKKIVPNPEYDSWLLKDQQLLSYLLNSISKDILARVTTLTSSAEVWSALEAMLSAHSMARVTNLRMQLATLKKGSMTTVAYFTKMCAIRDELAAVGKPIEDGEMASHILNGLGYDYNPFVSAMLGRLDPVPLSDLYSQLMAYDLRMEMYQGEAQYQSSANAAGRGRGGSRGRGNNRGRGRSSGNGSGGSGRRSNNNGANVPKKGQNVKPVCQICKREGHEAPRCWYRYDEDDEDDQQQNSKTEEWHQLDMGLTLIGMWTVEPQTTLLAI